MHSFERYSGAKSRIVRPKFCRVSARDSRARLSKFMSDLGKIKSSKRWRSRDFCSGRLSRTGAKDIGNNLSVLARNTTIARSAGNASGKKKRREHNSAPGVLLNYAMLFRTRS